MGARALDFASALEALLPGQVGYLGLSPAKKYAFIVSGLLFHVYAAGAGMVGSVLFQQTFATYPCLKYKTFIVSGFTFQVGRLLFGVCSYSGESYPDEVGRTRL